MDRKKTGVELFGFKRELFGLNHYDHFLRKSFIIKSWQIR